MNQLMNIMGNQTGNEELREFMDKLAISNVSRHVELPMIAVMGDTSSGKSSLLTAISMVELPSSDTLTTRCPIMLQMKRAERRTAKVTVQWKDQVPEGALSSSSAFLRQVDEGSWRSLTEYIAEAQAHILKAKHKTGTNDVSRDIVQVRVTGPDCEDLTLIDLPGIVRSTGAGESTSLVADIQSLIDEYLKNSRCVILAVHPANVDFHNSQIMADAKKVDPQTKRTLPVITKPDLIDVGAEDAVKELLLGLKTDKFEKGFHMVKCRGQKALNDRQSIQEGLKREAAFFDKTEPWRSIPNRRLFGIKELRVKLGELQIQMVRDSFPDILEEMKSQKKKAHESLQAMGEMCENMAEKRNFYMDAIRRLVNEVDGQVKGKSSFVARKRIHPSLAGAFHDLCDEFSKELAMSRLARISDLTIGVRVVVSDGTSEFKGKVITTNETHVWVNPEDIHDVACHKYIQFSVGESTEPEGTYWTTPFNQLAMVRNHGTYDVLLAIPNERVRRDASWIKEHLMENRSLLDLPIFPNPSVFNNIVSEFIEEDWERRCYGLLESVMRLLRDTLDSVFAPERRLSRYPRLTSYLKGRLDMIASKSYEEAHADLFHYLEKEKKPYTQNDYLNENIARLRSRWLEHALSEALGVGMGFDSKEVVSKSQIKSAIEGVFNHNRKKSLDDHMAEDMQHLLDAYGKVAYKRFADEVPKICKEILVNYARRTEEALSQLPEEQKLDLLISETPENRARFENLRQKVDDLAQGLAIIEGLRF